MKAVYPVRNRSQPGGVLFVGCESAKAFGERYRQCYGWRDCVAADGLMADALMADAIRRKRLRCQAGSEVDSHGLDDQYL